MQEWRNTTLRTAAMPYTLINRDTNSTVYNEVVKQLLKTGYWGLVSRNSPRFNLMLGDRNGLPYNRMGEPYSCGYCVQPIELTVPLL